MQSDNTILVVTSSDSSNGAPVFAAGCVVAEAARNISTLKEFISNAIENEMSGTKSNALPEMELPPGTGVKIPCWEKSKNGYTKANGYEDLDDYVTNLSDWKNPHGTNRTEKLKNAIHKAVEQGLFKNCSAKNIIVLLGDGMGESHLKASRNFYGKFVMDEIPNYCSALTESFVDEEGDLQTITDSGAGGTAIFCGEKTKYAYIGLDRKGNRVENIAEIARRKGKFVGSITNDHLGDATPASFLIHDTDRYHEHVIYTKEYLFAPDILMGTDCGIRNFLENDFNTALKNADEASKEYAETEDETYFSSEYFKNHKDEIIKECGVKTEEDFNKYPQIKSIVGYETFPEMVEKEFETGCKNRVVSFWDGNVPEYKPDSKVGFRMGENKKAPTFPEMVAFTLSFLDHKSKANGDCGFVCMIENTCCDGWGHAQLVAPIINEVQCFDEGVAIACKFVLENPDTLLIITADHENADLHFRKGWEENYKKIISMSSGHSAQLVPVIAFGAKAKEYFPKREDNVVQEACLTGRNLVKILSD